MESKGWSMDYRFYRKERNEFAMGAKMTDKPRELCETLANLAVKKLLCPI